MLVKIGRSGIKLLVIMMVFGCVSGCATVKGMGKDLETAGEKIQDAAGN